MPASKKLGRVEALAKSREAQRLVAAKGKKVTRIDLTQDNPADDTLAGLMLGPNLEQGRLGGDLKQWRKRMPRRYGVRRRRIFFNL